MKRVRNSRSQHKEAELDITAFMNLMIVLVPVLLLGMVFSQITVLDLKLPEAAADSASDSPEKKQIELLIRADALAVNYPRGILLKRIPKVDAEVEEGEIVSADSTAVESSAVVANAKVHDFKLLSLVLQEVKRQLREKGIENRAITVLSEPDTDYQTIISAMDTVRSYKAVVVTSVVDAELFPEVSFGDAPPVNDVVAGGDS
jgi:biopolymer transport protein ExbD